MPRLLVALASLILATSLLHAADLPSEKPAPAKTDTIEVTGTLQTGVMAIGGETTGIELTVDDKTTYGLLIKEPKLQKIAEELNGQKVTVTGTLTAGNGVERKNVKIIRVTALKKAPEKS